MLIKRTEFRIQNFKNNIRSWTECNLQSTRILKILLVNDSQNGSKSYQEATDKMHFATVAPVIQETEAKLNLVVESPLHIVLLNGMVDIMSKLRIMSSWSTSFVFVSWNVCAEG